MTDTELLQAMGIAGGPPQGQFSDEDVLSAVGMGTPQTPGAVTSPGAQPAGTQEVAPPMSEVTAQTLQPGKSSTSQSASASYSGFSPEQYAKVAKTQGPLAADMAKSQAETQARDQQDVANIGATNQKEARAAAKEGKAKIAEIEARGVGNAHLAELQNDFASEEANIVAQEQGAAAKSKADYVQAINEFRASAVNPHQLWDSLGKGGQFAAGVLAFAHGFLTIQGKKEEGMDLFLKGIDRNIDAQIQNIKIKGESAGMFKQLWDMQRAQSASDAEARTRVRGFALESAKLAVESELSKYESGLAQAQSRAAIAKIDQESAKQLFEVHKHIDTNATEFTKQKISVWAEGAKLSMEQKRLAEENRHNLATEENKKPIPGAGEIIDPETGKVFRTFKPEFMGKEFAGERSKILTSVGGLKASAGTINDIRTEAREVGARWGPLIGSPWGSEGERKIESMRSRMAQQMSRDVDGRVTAQEIELNLKSFPIETWTTNGGIDKILANAQRFVIDKVQGPLEQFSDPTGKQQRPFEKSYQDAYYTEHPLEASPEERQRKEIETGLSSNLGDKEAENPGTDVQHDAQRFVTEHPQAAEKVGGPYGEKIIQWEADLTHLRELAERGDDKALAIIKNQAAPYLRGLDTEDPQALYALMMLHDLNYTEEAPKNITQHETVPPRAR